MLYQSTLLETGIHGCTILVLNQKTQLSQYNLSWHASTFAFGEGLPFTVVTDTDVFTDKPVNVFYVSM